MARATPRVQQEMLDTPEGALPVGSPAWFAWLSEHRVFRFISSAGSFTARKERRAAGWYWYAYRRQHGLLRSAYLGKAEELTLERFAQAADELSTPSSPTKPTATLLGQNFLLATKITPPAIRASLIERPRLTDLLQKHATYRLLLITSPAGSGKTTLLSDWLGKLSWPVAWVSLDEGDNNLARFWSYVLAALQKLYPALAAHVLTLLPTLRAEAMEPFLVPLVNALATLPGDVLLVLDDYHVLHSQPVHESMAFLLEHAPDRLHLAIASRSLPSLPLARLRAQGHLAELNFADLRFTRQEAEALLQVLTERLLTPEELARLLESAEGWVTGLYLAALTLPSGHPESSYPSVLRGDHSYIFDYLASEVLAHQPARVRDFLLRTSVLERLHGALCEAVTLQDRGQDTLRQLERENLFLSPLDESHAWFRYHQLFADFLRAQLVQIYPGQAELLHRRAAEWFAQNNLPAEAIAHALQAGDSTLVAGLIEAQGRTMLMCHEVTTLGTWLRALPEEMVLSRPRLCLFASWVLLHTSHNEPIERYLCAAERCLEKDSVVVNEQRALQGEIAAIRARVAIYQDRIAQSVSLSRQALSLLAESDRYLRGEVALSLGTTSMVLDEMSAAEEAFREAIDLSWECGNLRAALLALRSLANLYVDQGRLHQAHRLYRNGLERVLREGQENLPPVGFLYVGLGELFYEWNDLESTDHYLREGIAFGQRGGDVKIWLLGYVWQIHVAQARGEYERAWSLFAEAEHLVRQASFARGQEVLTEVRLRLSSMQGDFAPLLRWAQTCSLDPEGEPNGLNEYEYYLLTQALIARNEPDSALRILRHLLERAWKTERHGYEITILLSLACAYELQGESESALEALDKALILAEPQGYIRTFINEGAPIVVLLKKMRQSYRQGALSARSGISGYFDRLFKSFRHTDGTEQDSPDATVTLTERLSKRELEVLHLLAAGHSNQEIAEMLIIGLNTVKTHLKNIYGKLEARNRTQAIARARSLQLL